MRAKMFELLGQHTGQPLERIERDFDRDRWMAAPEAVSYGLIDAVVDTRGELIEETAQLASIRR